MSYIYMHMYARLYIFLFFIKKYMLYIMYRPICNNNVKMCRRTRRRRTPSSCWLPITITKPVRVALYYIIYILLYIIIMYVCMYVCKDSAAPAHARTRAHRPAAPHHYILYICRYTYK